MTTSELNAVIIGALIAIFGASVLSIFRYIVTNRVESKKWKREQRAQEIDRIDTAAAEVTQHAGLLMSSTYIGGSSEHHRAQGNIKASFARWDMLVHLYCTEEEHEKIQKLLTSLINESSVHAVLAKTTTTVIEITHAVKERLANADDHPWWQFWNRNRPQN